MEFNALSEKEKSTEKEVKAKRSIFAPKRHLLEEIYPVREYLSQGYISLKIGNKERYMAILKVKTYDLYYLDEKQSNKLINEYWNLHQKYLTSFKEIYTTVNENNKLQQNYYQEKIEEETNPLRLRNLKKELDVLKYIEKKYIKESTFPCLFGDTISELEANIKEFKSITGRFLDCDLLPYDETVKVLYGLNNRYDKGNYANNFDEELSLYELTKPQGGLSLKNESYVKYGDGFGACVHIVSKPNLFLANWINDLVRKEGTFAVVDYFHMADIPHLANLDDSIEESIAQHNTAQNMTTKDTLETEINILRQLYQDIDKNGERIKNVHIRFYLREATLDQLEEKIDQLIKDLEGYNATVFLDEQKEEWQAIFYPFEEQLLLPNQREGLKFPAEALGVGFGYNQTNLSDPSAKYYGYTSSGGTVYWDLFHKTDKRLYYNFIALGDMGSGKSNILKMIFKDNADKGNYIRGFDVAGDYRTLTLHYDGAYISLDGTEGSINLLQVFPLVTKEDDENLEVDVEGSFTYHLSMLSKKLKSYNKKYTQSELDTFELKVRDFYIEIGLWENPDVPDITALTNDSYPLLEELVEYLDNFVSRNEGTYEAAQLSKIVSSLKRLVMTYGRLFNQYTTIQDIGEQQIVMFDIGKIVSWDVFDIQYENAMSLIQTALMRIGRRENQAYIRKLKPWNQIKRSLILVDECQNEYNVNKPEAVEELIKRMSEYRKFFIGIGLATQRIQNLFPNMNNVSDKETAIAADGLQKVLGLCQYKFIMKQDETTIPYIRKIFENSFTDLEYSMMTEFGVSKETGSRGILNIAGVGNIHMNFEITEKDLDLFGGGA